MKVIITKKAMVECENQFEIDLLRKCLQEAITHGSFVNSELDIVCKLEQQLLK